MSQELQTRQACEYARRNLLWENIVLRLKKYRSLSISAKVLASVLMLFYIESALSSEKEWFYVRASCSNCDESGYRALGHEANLRFFISNPVFAGRYDRECLGGAFYDKTGINGKLSNAFESEAVADRAITKIVGERRRKDYIVTKISLPSYCGR